MDLKVFFSWRNGDPDQVPGYPPADYAWNEADQRDFERQFEARVENAWSAAFTLESADGGRRLNVEVQVTVVPKAEDAHWRIEVTRYPIDGPDHQATVCYPGTSHLADGCEDHGERRRWGTARLTWTDRQPLNLRDFELPATDLEFAWASDVVPSLGSRPPLWLAGDPEWHFQLTGFADRAESASYLLRDAVALARLRTENLRAALREMVCRGEAGAMDPACVADLDQRLHIRNLGASGDSPLGSKRHYVHVEPFRTPAMDTLAHEAGHMLGLGDEAVVGSAWRGAPLLDPSYAAYVACHSGEVVTMSDEGLMSRGGRLRRWNYAPFVEAVESLTCQQGWRIPEGREPPKARPQCRRQENAEAKSSAAPLAAASSRQGTACGLFG